MLVNFCPLKFLRISIGFDKVISTSHFFSQRKHRKHVKVENVCREKKKDKSYLSWLNKSIICVLPFSLLKKMKRLQCINHILLWTWFKGVEKLCTRTFSTVSTFTQKKKKRKRKTAYNPNRRAGSKWRKTTLESIISFSRLSSSRAISQFCISTSAAIFPHNALRLLSLLVHKALYWYR